jgi:hypothetical protein
MNNHIKRLADAVPDADERQPTPLAHRPPTELLIGTEGVRLRERSAVGEAWIEAEYFERLEDWR